MISIDALCIAFATTSASPLRPRLTIRALINALKIGPVSPLTIPTGPHNDGVGGPSIRRSDDHVAHRHVSGHPETDNTHEIVARVILKLNPEPRHNPRDAHQSKPRTGDPGGDVTLVCIEVIKSRIQLGSCRATLQFAVVEDPRSDQLHVSIAERDVTTGDDLRPRRVERVAVMRSGPGLDTFPDTSLGERRRRGRIGELRTATLELLPAPTRAPRIPIDHAHHHDATARSGCKERGQHAPAVTTTTATDHRHTGPGPA